MAINNLNASYRQSRPGGYYKWPKCLKSFYLLENYSPHIAICEGLNLVQNERVPKPAILQFKDEDKSIDAPVVMYADIEAILEKLEQQNHGNTIRQTIHRPCAIGSM